MNNKLLKSSLIVVALSAALVGCGDDTTSEQHLISGNKYLGSGDDKAAVIEYKNALKKDPQNVLARLALGKIYQARGDLPAAAKELSRAMDKDATRRDAIIPYAMVLNRMGDSQEVLDLALLSSRLSNEDMAHAHYLRAQSFLRLEKEGKGRIELSQCSKIDGVGDYQRLCAAHLALFEQKFEPALVIVEQLLKQSPNMAEALYLSGAIYTQQKRYTQAVASYRTYIEHHNNSGSAVAAVNLLLAEALVNNNQMDEAKAEIDIIFKRAPLQPIANFLMARMLFAEESFKLTLFHAQITTKSIPSHFSANLLGGVSAFRLGDYSESYHMLTKIERQLSGRTLPIIMNVINNIKRGEVEHSRQLLSQAGAIDSKSARLYMLAANEFRLAQDYETALSILERVQSVMPHSMALKFQLGRLKLQMNDQSGLADLRRAVFDPAYSDQALPILAQGYFRASKESELKDIAQQLKRKMPNHKSGWLLASMLALKENKLGVAKNELEHILSLNDKDVGALTHLTKIHAQEKDYQAGLAYIERALAQKPMSVELLTLKARLIYVTTDDKAQADAVLKQAYEQYSDDNDLIVERAIIHARDNELKQGILLLASISDKPGLSDKYWNSYGNLLVKDKRNGEALSIFEKWAVQNPSAPAPLLKQLVLTEQLGLYDQGLTVIAVAKKNFAHILQFHLLEVSFNLMAGKGDIARSVFNRLKPDQHNEDAYRLVQGELLITEKKYQAGIDILLPLYKKNPILRTLKQVAVGYSKLKQPKKLVALLEQHLKTSPNANQVKPILANAYTQIGANDKAQETYLELVDKYPKSAIILNNLAWVLYTSGDYKQALEYADKAIEINDDNAQILDTHGMILIKLKQMDKAKISLTKALSLQPRNFAINAHNAQLSLAMGNKDKAKLLLNSVNAETQEDKKLYQEIAQQL